MPSTLTAGASYFSSSSIATTNASKSARVASRLIHAHIMKSASVRRSTLSGLHRRPEIVRDARERGVHALAKRRRVDVASEQQACTQVKDWHLRLHVHQSFSPCSASTRSARLPLAELLPKGSYVGASPPAGAGVDFAIQYLSKCSRGMHVELGFERA
jgi:hypothetical protein